jgi:hypothetical protein
MKGTMHLIVVADLLRLEFRDIYILSLQFYEMYQQANLLDLLANSSLDV